MSGINLELFFDKSDCREHLRAPFNFNGKTYATNCYAMICVPQRDGVQELENEPLKSSINRYFGDQGKDYQPFTDKVELPEKEKCSTCKGSGKATIRKCEECEGDGELELESDYNYYYVTCKSCNGDGSKTVSGGNEDCQRCGGAGSGYDRWAYVAINGVNIAPKYAEIIIAMPDLNVFAKPEDMILYFKSGDDEGVIMGIRV